MGVGSLRSSITISFTVHGIFFLLCLLLMKLYAPVHSPRQMTWIEIDDRLLEKKKRQDESLRKQVVQTAKGQQVEKAPDQAFLGERNQKVDRQTVNKNRNTVIGSTQQASRQSSTQAQNQLQDRPTTSQANPLSSLGLPILPRLQPKQEDRPQWANIGSLPQDYIKGLKESETTALNTKEYVFYGYFQRIRERLDRAWVPILRERIHKMYRSGRHLASEMDHTTRVVVTLNQKGEIIKVAVIGASGVMDLDDAAVRAFNQAGPFPNPPRGIIDAKGIIEIPWEFVLKT
jgi:TonB family protein